MFCAQTAQVTHDYRFNSQLVSSATWRRLPRAGKVGRAGLQACPLPRRLLKGGKLRQGDNLNAIKMGFMPSHSLSSVGRLLVK